MESIGRWSLKIESEIEPSSRSCSSTSTAAVARQAIWVDSCSGERTHFLPCRYLHAFIHPFPAVRCRGTKVGAHGTPGGRARPRQSCVAVSRSCNARVCPAPPASAVRRHGWLKCAPALASSQGPAISARPASAERPHRLSSTPTQSHPETPPRARPSSARAPPRAVPGSGARPLE